MSRRRRPGRLPGTPAAKRGAWAQPVTCLKCGAFYIHMELSFVDDDPYGLPSGMRCECGGELVAARRSVA